MTPISGTEEAKIDGVSFIFGDHRMDWDDLRVFIAVASAGSLAGGARRARVSQATAWRRIRALEESVGMALFERTATGYALMPAGANLVDALDGVQRAIEAAQGRLATAPDTIAGEVRVVAPEFVALMLAPRLPALGERHPELVIELLTGSPAATLLARDVDIAVRAERGTVPGFVPERSFAVPFGVYASAAYLRRHGRPRAIDDLAGHRLIDFDHSMAHIAPRPWLRGRGQGARVVFRSNSPHARLAACRAGLGLAMLPEPLARGASVRDVLPPAQVGTLDLVVYVASQLRRQPRVAAVRDFVAETLAA